MLIPVLHITASIRQTPISLDREFSRHRKCLKQTLVGEAGRLGNQAVLTQRAEFAVVVLGTIFLFMGFAACAIAAVRRGSTGRILTWFGIFSAMYGVRLFAEVPAAFSLLVGRFSSSALQIVWIITYVILIPGLFSGQS
jgi:lysylphosphatidylglycerol synthetase-like protein (DUF2156 family)